MNPWGGAYKTIMSKVKGRRSPVITCSEIAALNSGESFSTKYGSHLDSILNKALKTVVEIEKEHYPHNGRIRN